MSATNKIERFIHYLHEYERSRDNKEVYRCTHPRCTHYQKRAYLIGKEAVCFKCKKPFLLSIQQLRNKRPVCDYCSKSPKAARLKEAEKVALQIMNLDNLPEDITQSLIDSTLE